VRFQAALPTERQRAIRGCRKSCGQKVRRKRTSFERYCGAKKDRRTRRNQFKLKGTQRIARQSPGVFESWRRVVFRGKKPGVGPCICKGSEDRRKTRRPQRDALADWNWGLKTQSCTGKRPVSITKGRRMRPYDDLPISILWKRTGGQIPGYES